MLVAPDGWSPEHGPVEDGVSFDQQLAWDLLSNFAEASEALGVDEQERTKALSMRGKLLGPRVGKWGQLQEWMLDRDDPNDKHRHLSHLIAVHPGRQVSPLTTPGLAEAARVSMNARGDGATGWSKAWKISIWARLHDGNRAHKLLGEMLRGNVSDNLFDAHPPFQIDGNFGYASGVCEMLIQSHMGQIRPSAGLTRSVVRREIKGLRARGAFEVDMSWKDGRLSKAVIRSDKGSDCILRTGMPVSVEQNGMKVQVLDIEHGVVSFPTEAGKQYQVLPYGADRENLLTYAEGRLSNGIISVVFDEQGGFSIHDAESEEVLLSDARFGLPRGKREESLRCLPRMSRMRWALANAWCWKSPISTNWVTGDGPARHMQPDLHLYPLRKQPGPGVRIRSQDAELSQLPADGKHPLGRRASLWRQGNQTGHDAERRGMDKTLVTPGLNRRSPNSLMLTGLVDGKRRTAVWGGLGNEAFGKFTILQDGSPTFYADDPIGRLVDEEETYIAGDTFYIDVHTRDPFEALERYGWAMRTGQQRLAQRL